MATDTRTVINYLEDNATFRARGAGMAAQFDAIGFERTADTGQADWSTALMADASSDLVWEIRKFSDSLQATKPIYVKIWYKLGANPGYGYSQAQLDFQTGTGTNGSGALTGRVSARSGAYPYGSSGVSDEAYASHGEGWFHLAWGIHDGWTSGVFVAIERTGSDTTTPVLVVKTKADYASAPTYCCVTAESGSGFSAQDLQGMRSMNMQPAVGSRVALWPYRYLVNGKERASKFMIYKISTMTERLAQVVKVNGADRTYMPLGNECGSVTGPSSVGGDQDGVAMLWE